MLLRVDEGRHLLKVSNIGCLVKGSIVIVLLRLGLSGLRVGKLEKASLNLTFQVLRNFGAQLVARNRECHRMIDIVNLVAEALVVIDD